MYCPHSLEMSLAYGPRLNHPLHLMTNISGLPVLSTFRPKKQVAGSRNSRLSTNRIRPSVLAILAENSRENCFGVGLTPDPRIPYRLSINRTQ
jgi:hypothetical protein